MQDRPFFAKLRKLSQERQAFKERTLEAITWFRKMVEEIAGNRFIDPADYYQKNNYEDKPVPGNIITFFYRPVGAGKLQYYDKFPLVLVIKRVQGGFLGLNFHYLHPLDRAIFMDRLYNYQRVLSKDQRVIINIKYKKLISERRLIYYKPCIKRYINKRIGSMMHTLLPTEWDVALFLPTEKWDGARKNQVWAESKRIVKRNS